MQAPDSKRHGQFTELLRKLPLPRQFLRILIIVAIALVASLPTLWLVYPWIKYPLFILQISAILTIYLMLHNKDDLKFGKKVKVHRLMQASALYPDIILIVSSSILFLLSTYSIDGGISQLLLALLCTSILSGHALVRIFRIDNYLSRLEVVVLSYILSLTFSGIITLSLLSFDQYVRGTVIPLLFVSVGLISIIRHRNLHDRNSTHEKRPRSLARRVDMFSIFFALGFYLVFFTFMYPNAALSPGMDVARHFNNSIVLLRTPETYIAGNYLLFHAFQASIHVLSGLEQHITSIQTSQVLLNLFLPLTVYIFARRFLGSFDARIPAISTIFYTILSNLSFIYFLQLKLLDDTGSEFIVLAREVAEKAYHGIINFSQPFHFYFPTSVAFIMLMFVFILLRVRNMPRFTYVPLFSTIIFAMFYVHRVEAILFVMILAVFSIVFKAKNELRLDDALVASLIGFIFVDVFYFYTVSSWTLDVSDTRLSTNNILSVFLPLPVITSAIIWRWKVQPRLPTIRLNRHILSSSKFYSLLSLSLISIYLLGFLAWLAIEDFRSSSIYEIGVVPWFIYPVLMGIVGILMLLSLRYMGNFLARPPIAILLFSILFLFLMGKLVSYVSANLFVVDYWEKRFVTLIFLLACLFAPIPLIRLKEFLDQTRRNTLRSAALTVMLSVVVLLGFSSTAVQAEFWFTSSNGENFKVSEKELEAVNFLKNIFQNDKNAFTISPTMYSREVVTLAAPPYQFSKPQISVFPRYPDVPLLTLASHNLDHAYVYMHDRDFRVLQDQKPYGWLDQHILPLLPIVFSNDEVTIYNVTKVSYPLPNSQSVLLIPGDPRQSNWLYAYDIIAQSGKNYTVRFDEDPQSLRSRNVILSFDPIERYSFYDNFSSPTSNQWDILSGKWERGMDGGLKAGGNDLFGNILSPVVSRTTDFNVTTSFNIADLEPNAANYVSIIYSWVNPNNFRYGGITQLDNQWYAAFGEVRNGIFSWDPAWPGQRVDLEWEPGDSLNMTLELKDKLDVIAINGVELLSKNSSERERGHLGLAYGRIPDVTFSDFRVVDHGNVDIRQPSDYIAYVNAGGNLTVINTDGRHGLIYDYLFNGMLSEDDSNMTGITFTLNATNPDGKTTTMNENISPAYFNSTNGNKLTVPVTEVNLGRGKITYIELSPLLSNLAGNTYSKADYEILHEISTLIKGLEELDALHPNLNEIAAFYKEIHGTASRLNIIAESAIFPDDVRLDGLAVRHGNNIVTTIENVTSIDVDSYRNIDLRATDVNMSLSNGRGLYSNILLNNEFDNSSLNFFFQGGAILDISDSSGSHHFENVTDINVNGDIRNFGAYMRQPSIKVDDGVLTINELHATRQLYERTGALGDNVSIVGDISLGVYLSDYYSFARHLSVEGSVQRIAPLTDTDPVKSTAPQVAISNLYFIPPYIRGVILLPFIITGVFMIFVKPRHPK